MMHLRPITILLLGCSLMGIIVAGLFAILGTAVPTIRAGVIQFLIGSATGLLLFGPLALAEKYRMPLVSRLAPHAYAIHWYTSIIMAFACGYVAACMLTRASNGLTAIALVTVFLGALIKTLLGMVFDRREAK